MTLTSWLLIFVGLLATGVLFLVANVLTRIEDRIGQLAGTDVPESVHDTLHPVFSVRQLRQTRMRFAHHYKEWARRERALYASQLWITRRERSEPSDDLRAKLREICEALVEAECAWREYAYMVAGNVAAALRGEPPQRVVAGFTALLRETRGSAGATSAVPNALKLQRVKLWQENWVARLRGDLGQGIAEFFFRDVWEER